MVYPCQRILVKHNVKLEMIFWIINILWCTPLIRGGYHCFIQWVISCQIESSYAGIYFYILSPITRSHIYVSGQIKNYARDGNQNGHLNSKTSGQDVCQLFYNTHVPLSPQGPQGSVSTSLGTHCGWDRFLGERLGSWLDSFLQPLIPISPTFIKDSKHVVSLLNCQPWKKEYKWLICDVVALYPSIPHNQAIVLGDYLNTYSSYTLEAKEFHLMVTEFL